MTNNGKRPIGNRPLRYDLILIGLIIAGMSVLMFLLDTHGCFDVLARRRLERNPVHVEELLIVLAVVMFAVGMLYFRKWQELKREITKHAALEMTLEQCRDRLEDLVEKRTAEATMMHKQVEHILGATRTGLDIIDSNYNIRYINPAWQKVYGDPRGKKCYDYFMGRKEVCPDCGVTKAFATKRTVTAEEILVREGNRPIEVTTIPYQDEKGEWLVAEINVDISARKKVEEEVKRYQRHLEELVAERTAEIVEKTKALEQALKVKEEFTGMVSHELRTPLGVIKESIALLDSSPAPGWGAEQQEILDIAKRNIDRLTRLINDVLDFQKIDSGKMIFRIDANDVNDVVRDVERTMLSSIGRKGLTLRLVLDESLPQVRFDRDRIFQVLLNIVGNALTFTERGGITITTALDGLCVRVSVSDTGPGIREEDRERIFKKFVQVVRRPGGTGLGLTISKEIIDAHHGSIWVESEIGKGSTFHVTLPR